MIRATQGLAEGPAESTATETSESVSRTAPSEAKRALTPRQILINNEQVKLTANATNAVAVAFILGGGAGVYADFGSSYDLTSVIGRAVLWIGVGGFLHWIARRNLRNLL